MTEIPPVKLSQIPPGKIYTWTNELKVTTNDPMSSNYNYYLLYKIQHPNSNNYNSPYNDKKNYGNMLLNTHIWTRTDIYDFDICMDDPEKHEHCMEIYLKLKATIADNSNAYRPMNHYKYYVAYMEEHLGSDLGG